MLDMSGYKLESTGEEETNDPAKTLLEGDQQPLVELNAPLDDRESCRCIIDPSKTLMLISFIRNQQRWRRRNRRVHSRPPPEH